MTDLQVLEVLGALVLALHHVNGLQLPIVDILLHQGGEHPLGAGREEGSVDGDSHGVCKQVCNQSEKQTQNPQNAAMIQDL